MRSWRRTRGFALPIVLWLIVTMTVAAVVVAITAREAVGAAANRVGLARAQWLAEGCANVILSQLEEWLDTPPDAATQWAMLDSSGAQPAPTACREDLRPAGLVLEVNSATESQLVRFALAAGLEQARAESLAAAIVDWRDTDDEPRPHGVEQEWYLQTARVPPRNAPFGASPEILLVHGADWLPGIDSLIGIDGDPVLLTRATSVVMSGLPGMSDEALIAIIDARRENPFPDLGTIAERLSDASKLEFVAALQSLYQLTSAQPVAWILTVTARAPIDSIEASIELRLARDNSRIALVRRRTWP